MKKLVLFVEGEGESEAAPILIKRLLTLKNAWETVTLDESPFRVGSINHITKNGFREWNHKLQACLKRKNVGGVLLLLDGDIRTVNGIAFCAAELAKSLAKESKSVGGGKIFSVAIVFACQEYESWIIAGISSLVGKMLSGGRQIQDGALNQIVPNPEIAPRDAKGWLSKFIEGGYRPTMDQAELTRLIDIETIRHQNVRSFVRLENAVDQLVNAIKVGSHIATPN